jgi:hypothetical protein
MKKILFINGSNVIGGGELSLVSIAKSFTNSCVLSFDYGPFTELLKKEKISSIVPTSTKSFLSIKKGHSISSLFANLTAALPICSLNSSSSLGEGDSSIIF